MAWLNPWPILKTQDRTFNQESSLTNHCAGSNWVSTSLLTRVTKFGEELLLTPSNVTGSHTQWFTTFHWEVGKCCSSHLVFRLIKGFYIHLILLSSIKLQLILITYPSSGLYVLSGHLCNITFQFRCELLLLYHCVCLGKKWSHWKCILRCVTLRFFLFGEYPPFNLASIRHFTRKPFVREQRFPKPPPQSPKLFENNNRWFQTPPVIENSKCRQIPYIHVTFSAFFSYLYCNLIQYFFSISLIF